MNENLEKVFDSILNEGLFSNKKNDDWDYDEKPINSGVLWGKDFPNELYNATLDVIDNHSSLSPEAIIRGVKQSYKTLMKNLKNPVN